MKLLKYLMLFIFLNNALLINAQPGSLNINFGNNGIVAETGFGSIRTSAIQSNGNILVGGSGILDTVAGFFIASYLPNGLLDSSFGVNGRTVADLGIYDKIQKIIIQPDGKILAAGYTYRNIFTGSEYLEPNYNIALARFMPNGSLDSSFGENGKIETDFGDIEQVNSMVLQKDGKIVVGGNAAIFHPGGSFDDFLLVRYLSNGKLDSSFGNNGQIRTSFTLQSQDVINSLVIQTDGKIIAGGRTAPIAKNFDARIMLSRYNVNGSLDNSFGTGGIVATEFGPNNESIEDIALQEDGKILGTGWAILTRLGFYQKMILIRYLSNGDVDDTFGVLGKLTIKFDEEIVSSGQSLALQTNGKIVVGGFVVALQSVGGEFALARCLPNGNLDSSFGTNGTVITDIKEEDDGRSCVINREGTIFLSGTATSPGFPGLAIVSYNGDPVKTLPTISQIKRWIRNHILHFEDANTNAAYYVIEKSTATNTAFVPVTRITANAAATNYSYTLPENTTKSTYRIKAVNKDNSITYSSPISSSDPAKAGVPSFKIYPNPAKDRIAVETPGTVQLRLQNSNGRVLLTQTVNGKGSIDISKLPNGIYYVVNTANGESLKVVKE